MTAPPIKMLALDLDGTVFRNDKTISQHTKDAIAAAIAKGVVVIPATGRALNGLPEEILALEGIQYALTSNGAAIWSLKDRKKLVDLPFSTQDTIAAMELMEAYDCMLDVYLESVYQLFYVGKSRNLCTARNAGICAKNQNCHGKPKAIYCRKWVQSRKDYHVFSG